MNWNEHGDLRGLHAPLSASQSAWVNYDDDRLRQYIANLRAKEKGTLDHEFANYAIANRYKMANHKKTLHMFINDCIGFHMQSEQILFFSENCFGTADAIKYDEKNKLLKIFDLKTGYIKVSFRQLHVYTAIFCLEYNVDPYDIGIELRVYQSNNILIDEPDPMIIKDIMDTIIRFDRVISGLSV